MEMARIGATEKGGVCRLTLTELDKQGRDLFARWCRDAGCTVSVDKMGNMFARRPGRDQSLPPVGTGSHLDTQPTGGKFDGVYGVLAGLEVLRTLQDHEVETEAPIEVSVWTNEEGARFTPAMVGSGVYAGEFDLEESWAQCDGDGVSLGEALDIIGYKGEQTPGSHRFGAFFEAHIEQGPVLETAGKTIGIVTAVQGMRWYDVTLTGDEVHAGPTPMDRRHDPIVALAELLPRVYRLALDRAPNGRATVANFHTEPESRNTVPGVCRFSVDLRHPDGDELEAMDAGLKAAAAQVAEAHGLGHSVADVWNSPPIAFDAGCVDAVRKGAGIMNYSAMEVVSGAGHDAVYISRTAPTGMIFIPCEDGISHNESENATAGDCAAGANVLLHAMLDHAKG
jgi:N-carbamoyl-L-amino-acid hydrolase